MLRLHEFRRAAREQKAVRLMRFSTPVSAAVRPNVGARGMSATQSLKKCKRRDSSGLPQRLIAMTGRWSSAAPMILLKAHSFRSKGGKSVRALTLHG